MSNKIEIEKLHILSKYGRHISGFFHNLNTPLMGISGRLELLSFTQPDLKGLSQMTEQLERIEAIMNNFTKILENDKREDSSNIDLNDLINEIDTFFYTNLKYKHKLTVKKELGDISTISINTSNIQNFLINLTNFYLEIIPNNGNLFIKTQEIDSKTILMFQGNETTIDSQLVDRLINESYSTFKDDEILFFIKYFIKKLNLEVNFSLESNNFITEIIID